MMAAVLTAAVPRYFASDFSPGIHRRFFIQLQPHALSPIVSKSELWLGQVRYKKFKAAMHGLSCLDS